MKRKFLIVFMTIICALCLAFALTACGGGSSNSNDSGDNGNNTNQSQPNDDDDDDNNQSQSGGNSGTTPSTPHTHTLTKTEKVEATCTTAGNIEYWYCSGCLKYFSDEAANTEVTKAETVIPALEHTYGSDDVCTVCHEHKPTEGLTFSDSTNGLAVSLGTATDANIYIPSTYNGEMVVVIYNNAFNNCTTLESITLPDTIKYINGGAFEGCTNLTSITIPDSVTSIYDSAFENCTALTSVNYTGTASQWASISLSNTVSNPLYYGGNLYLNGTLATDITIENITEIGRYAFYNCPTIKSVTIGDGVTTIGYNAFYKCTSLEKLTINGAITSMGSETFSGCTALKSVTLTDGITTIGGFTFMDCTALESIIIPDSVTYMGYGTFYNCSALESVTLPSGITTIYGNDLNGGAFYGCSSLTSIAIPDNVTSIGQYAFYECSALKSVTFGENSLLEEIGLEAFSGCCLLTSITIPSNVTSIARTAFSGCYKLVEVYNLSSLELTAGNSDYGAAYYAKNVYTATEGSSGLFTEGDFLFYHEKDNSNATYYLIAYNGSDEEITLPKIKNENEEEVNYEINRYAFYNEQTVTSITVPLNVTNIGEYAFCGCTSEIIWNFSVSASIVGTVGLTTIGTAFNGYAGTSITIPETVTRIYSYAFLDCNALTSFVVKNSSTYFKAIDGNLYNYDGTKLLNYASGKTDASFTVPAGVTTIGSYAFYGCTTLKSVTIPDSVTSIGDNAFWHCTSLTSVDLGSGVTTIGDYAFYGCTSLKSVTIPNSVTSIDWRAFAGCTSLESVVIGSGVTTIGDYAFYGCTSLITITIPASVTSIGGYAFHRCFKLVEVYNLSSLELTAGSSDNGYAAYYAKYVYTTTESPSNLITDGDFQFYSEEDAEGNAEYYLIAYTGSSTTVELPTTINGTAINYEIYSYAFYDNTTIETVIIPDCVTLIGDYAFDDCTSLESVTIGNSVTSIGEYAFYNCDSLTSITIGNSLTSIGDSAFEYCTALTNITIPESVTSIGNYAFWRCSSLKSIYYNGNTSQWAAITFDDYYSNPTSYGATLYYYSETQPTESGNYWHYDGDGNIAIW